MARATMHLDGCHFFAWVFENSAGEYELTLYERRGDDLATHADNSDCSRCAALLNGATMREWPPTVIDLPDDAKEAFFVVVGTIGQLDDPSGPTSERRDDGD